MATAEMPLLFPGAGAGTGHWCYSDGVPVCVLAAGKAIQSSAQVSALFWGCVLSILNCKMAT